MMTTKWLAAAALVTATMAAPALAQDRMSGDMTRAEMKAQAKQERAAQRDAVRSQRAAQRNRGYSDRDSFSDGDDFFASNDGFNNNDGYWRSSNSGFFPGDVVGGVVGGAVGIAGSAVNTAGAIATAPFGGFDNGYNRGYNDSFASYDNGWDRGGNNTGFFGEGNFFGDSNASFQDDGFNTGPRTTRRQARANTPGVNPLNNGSNAVNQSASYAERNGFVCTPGTYYQNVGGRQVLCQ